MRTFDVHHAPVEVDVSAVVPMPGDHMMRGWMCAPTTRPQTPVLLYCLAGGACTTDYFDLEVPGFDGYSMARHLAGLGITVAALDHPGIGASTAIDDLFVVTPSLVAQAHGHAAAELVRRLEEGTAPGPIPAQPGIMRVGLGHSMGAMLVEVQQACHHSFDMTVALGFGGAGLPEVLVDEERRLGRQALEEVEAEAVNLARARFGSDSTIESRSPAIGTFFTADVPGAVQEAFAAHSTELLPTCGLIAMVPGGTDPLRESLTKPVFVAFGDNDLITQPQASVARYRASSDITAYVLRGSGHCHNQAGSRVELWDRVERWIRSMVE